MRTTDWIIFVAYLAGMLGMGALFSRRQKSDKEFFLAGRSMHWLPVGLSLMATLFSAISYTAFPSEIFGHGLYAVMGMPIHVLVAIPAIYLILPFYHDMQLCSAYEYLEKRFDVRVRCLASGLFILWRVFWMATALYAPCKVLNVIMFGATADGGQSRLVILILIAGIVSTVYTVMGGMRAVMWTDVAQFFVFIGGMIIGIVVSASSTDGGFAGLIRTSADGGLLKPFYPFDPGMFSIDPRARITLWSCWIGTAVALMANYCADQVAVQRYFTAKDLREAKRGFHLNYLSMMFTYICMAMLGFAVYAFAKANGLLEIEGLTGEDCFSKFIQSCPYGVTGLLVAGLFAATMSSVDSGINSCSAAFITDFYNRFRFGIRNAAEAETAEEKSSEAARHDVALSRGLTLGLGALATLMACFVGRLGSIFEIANKVINGSGSPLLALFLMGMFSRRANAPGMFVGGILGAAWSAFTSFAVKGISLHYYSVVNLCGTIVLCAVFSEIFNLISGGPSEEQRKWMWRVRMQSRSCKVPPG
ncbi:MAG TPA: sodium/solute symporter [Candidatus Brocadiia bacterium]|nr:sodium/solute symporter [Candidatus Brocadiia bacterium]